VKSKSPTPPSTPPSASKRIFIVEDHPIFRRGLVHLIESEPGFIVCGYAASFPVALAGLRRVQADVAILDIAIEGANGLELIKHLRAEHPNLALLVLSVHDESVYGTRALRAGARGYVMKREADEVLFQAIRKVLDGEVFVSEALSRDLLYRIAFHNEGGGKSPIASLSDRELEVLDLVGHGLATRDIARKLHISVKTVESHRLNLRVKLGLAHASELIRFAVQWMEEQKGSGVPSGPDIISRTSESGLGSEIESKPGQAKKRNHKAGARGKA
jgi:DNA-binding NarL/FixJ family response regulator